ncbi:MAG TPA: hypothetical protein VNM67_22125 [Thermoanaerobaculia bacterium]|jgi:hypothetical protein|nr:hypothetical protein [Thermoanaerobaculia bacterium]
MSILLALFTYQVGAQQQPSSDSANPPMTSEEFKLCVEQFSEAPTLSAEDKEEIQLQGTDRFQTTKLPLGASDIGPQVTTAVSLITGEKDGRGLLSYSRNDQTSDGRINDWSLKVSAPFNKAEGQASLASLSGLSGDIVVSGAFSRFTWDIEPSDYGAALCQECMTQRLSLLECNLADLKTTLEKRGSTAEEIEEAVESLGSKIFGTTTSWFWGGEGSVGRKERSFFEPAGTKSKEDRSGYSLALTGGAMFESWSLYGRVTGKRDYKDRSSATFCSPITGSVLESCSSLPLGQAAKVESTVAALEARRFFGTLAVAPSAQYDFDSSVWGLEVPVFLTRDQKGAFTGGVKLGWRSDERDPIATVFITKGLEP